MGKTRSIAALTRGGATVLLLTISAALAQAQGLDDVHEFHIEAQPLDAALIEFSEQADLQLMVQTELVTGRQSAGVSGALTASDALLALLNDTDLAFQAVGEDTVAVSQADARGDSDSGNGRTAGAMPKPAMMAQAAVEQSQTTRRTETDSDEEEIKRTIEEIVVTGTNIKGVENPTVSVFKFDREELQLSGIGSLDDFARQLPQNFTGGFSPLVLQSGVERPSDQSYSTGFELRGLGAGSTLTLLDGRRMVGIGDERAVDIRAIPFSLIERVDVQTDGASAVYGTDAIGGVVNIITRSDFEGVEVSGRAASVTDGGKQDYNASLLAGRNWRGGNGVVAVSYIDKEPLFYRERDFVDQSGSLFVRDPARSFVGDEQVFSAFGAFKQNLGDHAQFRSKVISSQRDYEFSTFGRRSVVDNETFISSSALDYNFSDDLSASLTVDYSFSRNTNDEFRPDGSLNSGAMYENALAIVEGNVSGRIEKFTFFPVDFALGSFFERNKHEARTEIPILNRITLFDVDQNVFGGYSEFIIRLIEPQQSTSFLEQFDVSLAGRYQDYERFGDNFSPKVGFFAGTRLGIDFRASYSESFRTPNLTSLNLPTVVANDYADPNLSDEENLRNQQEFGLPPNTAIAIEISNGAKLTPETAESINIGFEYSPPHHQNIGLGLSYFNVEYADRIDSIGSVDVFIRPELNMFIQRNPNPALVQSILDNSNDPNVFSRFLQLLPGNVFQIAEPEDYNAVISTGNQNVSFVEVSGIDFFASYDWDMAGGSVSAKFSGALLTKNDFKFAPEAPRVDLLDVAFRPTNLDLRTSLSWSRDGWTLFSAVNYVDGYTNDTVDPIEEIDTYTTVDLSVGYDTSGYDTSLANLSGLLSGTRVQLSVTNLFDEDPPFVSAANGLNFDPGNADPFGRIISLQITKTF